MKMMISDLLPQEEIAWAGQRLVPRESFFAFGLFVFKMAAGKYKLDDIRVAPLDGRFVADRNGGIVMLFGGDSHEPDSVIMSPFNNFMVQHNVMDLENGNLYYGVQGGAKEIPPGYIASTIVQGSVDGIREAVYSWGENLRNWYDRHQHFRNSDIFVTHLGTDLTFISELGKPRSSSTEDFRRKF